MPSVGIWGSKGYKSEDLGNDIKKTGDVSNPKREGEEEGNGAKEDNGAEE